MSMLYLVIFENVAKADLLISYMYVLDAWANMELYSLFDPPGLVLTWRKYAHYSASL